MMTRASGNLEPIAVALDTPDWSRFEEWCRLFGPRVGVLKVGLEAFVRWGRPAVETALTHGRRVFLDLKLHDIPNTVAGAVAAASDLGVHYLTIHAGGGFEMMRQAKQAAGPELRLLAVTVLTHLDEPSLEALDLPGTSSERARRWAVLAQQAGAAGVVSSALEVETLRRHLPAPFELVTPGIRWQGTDAGDQRRVAGPRQALDRGADLLVIGRPLTAAPDPGQALAELEALLG
ncbi:MAG: orotidine-5'-phosphate decarboxylase [Acidobacteriota bacterium]